MPRADTGAFELVAIGTSAGGLQALKTLLAALPADYALPIAVVQHVAPGSDGSWADLLDAQCAIKVKEADEKERPVRGTAYVAPPNYHLLLEPDCSFTLTVDETVNYARPSIDVLFETAAEALGPHLVGIVLTGGNSDGARGLKYIKNKGGFAIVQDPLTAEVRAMPDAAILMAQPQLVLSLAGISGFLLELHTGKGNGGLR
jgi:two-component system, chemotaxis family, protein-glutamate methylesterase/glutaminase